MDILISMGISALLEALKDKKAIIRLAPAMAKVFVALERSSALTPTLAAAIERARQKS